MASSEERTRNCKRCPDPRPESAELVVAATADPSEEPDVENTKPPPAQAEAYGEGQRESTPSKDSSEGQPRAHGLLLRLADLAEAASEWMSLSLRSRCLLWMGFLVVTLVGTTAAIAVTVFPESFQHIEMDHMEENVRRFAIAVQTDLLSFKQKLVTYAQWDDTRSMLLQAVADPSDPRIESYMASNFPPNMFESLGIEYALFYDLEGSLVAKTKTEGLKVPRELASLDPSGRLWAEKAAGCDWSASGLFASAVDEELEEEWAAEEAENGLNEDVARVFLLTAASVCDSEALTEPAGTAVFARRMSSKELKSLAVRTQLCATVSALPFADPEPPDIEEAAAGLGTPYVATESWPWEGGSKPRLRALAAGYLAPGGAGYDGIRRCTGGEDPESKSLDRIAAYFSVASMFPEDGPILFRLDRPRDLVATGNTATRLMFLALLVIGATFFAAMLLFLEVMVLRALSSLTGQIRRIAATDDPSCRIAKPRFHSYDEIGVLAEALNLTLSVIQRSREAMARADEDARALLYSACPRPLAERLLGGEALVTGTRVVGTAVCLRLVSTHPEHSDPRSCAAGLALPRERAPTAEVVAGQVEQSSYVHVWNTILLSLDRLCAERGLDGFSLAGGDTLVGWTGLPTWSEDHARQAVQLAQDAVELVERVASFFSVPIAAKAGVASGWMMCGVVRRPALRRYQFNVWGAPVEEASRLALAAHPRRVALSAEGEARAAAATLAAETFLFGSPENAVPPPDPGDEVDDVKIDPPEEGPRLQLSIRPPFRAWRAQADDAPGGRGRLLAAPSSEARTREASESPQPPAGRSLSLPHAPPNESRSRESPLPQAAPAAFVELQRRPGRSQHLERLLPGADLDPLGPSPQRVVPSLSAEASFAAAAGLRGGLWVGRRLLAGLRPAPRLLKAGSASAAGSRPASGRLSTPASGSAGGTVRMGPSRNSNGAGTGFASTSFEGLAAASLAASAGNSLHGTFSGGGLAATLDRDPHPLPPTFEGPSEGPSTLASGRPPRPSPNPFLASPPAA